MRSEWEKATIADVCEIKGGGTPSKSVKRYWHGTIPWVSPKDMKCQVVTDSQDHITEEAIANSAASIVKKGAVLVVVRSGILARTVPIAIAGCDLAINQDLKALCPEKKLVPKYLYYVLESKMELLLSKVSRGATVHRLPSELLRQMELLVPPIDEQKKIVRRLDDAMAAFKLMQDAHREKMEVMTTLRMRLLQEFVSDI